MRRFKKFFSFRFYLKKLLEFKDRPEETARGLALGVFVGFLPISGFQILVAITIATFAKVNKVAAAIGTHVTNPWTTLPIFIVDYYLGCKVLKFLGFKVVEISFSSLTLSKIFSTGVAVLIPTFAGGVFLGIIFSISSYFGFKRFIENIRKKASSKEIADG